MAERPEDLNLPNAVVTRIIKDAVSLCSSTIHSFKGTTLINDSSNVFYKVNAYELWLECTRN